MSSNRKYPSECGVLESSLGWLTFIGGRSTGGTYILRIHVSAPLQVAFGRFKDGCPIDLKAGYYVYVGSALSRRGSTCLARRLLRHATRLNGNTPHAIRDLMLSEFRSVGLCDARTEPPTSKLARWQVDYLLDCSEVTLAGAYVIRSSCRLEAIVGKFLERDPGTEVFARGLGASDIGGNTHLLFVKPDNNWWDELSGRLVKLLRRHSTAQTSNP